MKSGRFAHVKYVPIHAKLPPTLRAVASRAIPSASALAVHTQLPFLTPSPRIDMTNNRGVFVLWSCQSTSLVYEVGWRTVYSSIS